MKKLINYFGRMLCALLLCAGLVITGCYDDSALQGQIGSLSDQLQDHESRLKELERLTAQQNTNISSLQTIVTALQDKDYVTSVAPIYEGDEVVGYTITFSKSGAVTIYNGKDGYVPVMGVKQDESDGQWYWTVDGEWLLDSKGDKVRASAEDGEDGAPGQPGVTPTLKIVDGYWYVSYDGGKTWEEETLGQATGDKGYTMFVEVTYDDEYLYITMADGEKLVLPRSSVGQEVEGPLTWSLDKVTEISATFSGSLTVQEADLPFSQVTVYYSDAETFNINDALKMSTTTFNSDQKFTIIVTGLKPNVKYNYCLIAEVKSEKIYSDVKDFTTIPLVSPTLEAASEVTYMSATISGKVNIPSEITNSLRYGFEYCPSQDFASGVVTGTLIDLDSENNFSVEISDLTPLTTYYYRSFIIMNGVLVYGESMSFKTLQHPYELTYDLDVSSAIDLSSSASANCYIISEAGFYKFKTVKGNSTTSVGSVASASILWETFGTDTAPELLDLISGFCYKDGYIAFQTADTFKKGNAVIAAKDADGNILWSWHIWLTDQPQSHVYNNNAGTMMDRNLGATSATPGDIGAFGLLYQWGRKDPFLGSSSISSNTIAKSTITWPSAVKSDSSNGTIDYATANPTTFITYNSSNNDWYYTGTSSTDNTRWTTSSSDKSIYDPCPAGWRVPDGGSNGIWSKAGFGTTTYDWTNGGMSFSISSPSTTWYPASGYRDYYDGGLSNVGNSGNYWSASPYGDYAYYLYFNYYGDVLPSYDDYRANGFSVRCLQE
ncbi:MAG: PL29 family lyase N-terminal domain-containing protein [Bacteroidales bacterium]|nr:PL29 family lyase N-terminal domain-containing protein [Bacteroidales bacterium]MDY6171424.1 PL29 family lyase N-terminal domain-containing protein [Candidatus Cryptobacteroides sp.]